MNKKPAVTYKNKSGVTTTLCGNDAIVWLLADLEKRVATLESGEQNKIAAASDA